MELLQGDLIRFLYYLLMEMTGIELSPELIANLESYMQMKVIVGYVGFGFSIAVLLTIGIVVLLDYLDY